MARGAGQPAPGFCSVRPAMNEANFDGLIGPTHNFAGLGAAAGNTASAAHAGREPRCRLRRHGASRRTLRRANPHP